MMPIVTELTEDELHTEDIKFVDDFFKSIGKVFVYG